jgi:hypothetical protein
MLFTEVEGRYSRGSRCRPGREGILRSSSQRRRTSSFQASLVDCFYRNSRAVQKGTTQRSCKHCDAANIVPSVSLSSPLDFFLNSSAKARPSMCARLLICPRLLMTDWELSIGTSSRDGLSTCQASRSVGGLRERVVCSFWDERSHKIWIFYSTSSCFVYRCSMKE